ncbi:MAG: VWA domain-containing protein [Opitutales bacterium]|nr:VWA domain-containing protein [Opitutales bacterium]
MLADKEILYVGAVIVLLALLLFRFSERAKQKKLQTLIAQNHLKKLVPLLSPIRRNVKLLFIMLALVFSFIALSRPQWGTKQRLATPRGIDILIAVDVSKSMLSRDVKPNRLERVKLGIQNLLEKVKSDRLGLIAFSGSSFLQCPLTLDHQAFLKTLEDLDAGIIKTPGTNLALPIEEASRSFATDDNDRFLILLSDGEDLEGEGLKRAKKAQAEGIKIYTIGVGSPEGSFIPTDPFHMPAKNFLKDRNGELIVTKMDPGSLQKIAKETNGRYFHLGPTGEGLAKAFEILQNIGQKRKKEQLSTNLPIERFQPFILLVLLLLFLETLVPNAKKYGSRLALKVLPFFLFFGCFKRDNIERAEEEIRQGNAAQAAQFYELEINASTSSGKEIDPRLFLNTGLAHLEGESLEIAERFLEASLDSSVDDPSLQSIALNSLGNIYYEKTNFHLDRQNVSEARKAWEKALGFYESAYELNGNEKASLNLISLKEQIEKRIQAFVCLIKGTMWKDINGDGIIQKNEPGLRGIIFWDKDNNGDLNATTEPQIPTDQEGNFVFEWISGIYPTNITIASKLSDQNHTQNSFLVPLFPAPPPPLNSSMVRNHLLNFDKAGSYSLLIPYRTAPTVKGEIWADENANGRKDANESGYSAASVFLDTNGNFQLDENETTFKPSQDGRFHVPVPPGQHAVHISLENPDANITYPIEQRKAYLTWVDFGSQSDELNFGVYDKSNQQGQPQAASQEQADPEAQDTEEDEESESQMEQVPQEINALYERLLQETESKSEPLEQTLPPAGILKNGRDY